MEGIPALQHVHNSIFQHVHTSSKRQSRKCHSQIESDDHMSLDMIEHVPSNIPQNPFLARFFTEVHELVIRRIRDQEKAKEEEEEMSVTEAQEGKTKDKDQMTLQRKKQSL